jgi:hypothetical protein
MTLDEKDIEVEERMIRGTRCSLRLNPMTNENETENDISEKENIQGMKKDYEMHVKTSIGEHETSYDVTSKQLMPKFMQKYINSRKA